MATPPTVTPQQPTWLGPIDNPQAKAAAQGEAQQADLNVSWRGLMGALGVALPHELNRAVTRSRTMHRAVS